jgi:hypothetical protein
MEGISSCLLTHKDIRNETIIAMLEQNEYEGMKRNRTVTNKPKALTKKTCVDATKEWKRKYQENV